MPVTGKTGADALFFLLRHASRLIVAYNLKLSTAIANAYATGAITAAQRDSINLFLANATAFALAFEALAQYAGF